MDIVEIIARELAISSAQVKTVFSLLDDGNTIPFIARYRKEMHGGLDDGILRSLFTRREYLTNLLERKQTVINSLREQKVEDEHIFEQIEEAMTLAEVEDIYRPYKPKRKTRGTMAIAKGLEPLANIILAQKEVLTDQAIISRFVGEKKAADVDEAMAGARDIIAEKWADIASLRATIRTAIKSQGQVHSTKKSEDEKGIFANYYDYKEAVKSIPNHRILALNRGSKLEILKMDILFDIEEFAKVKAKSFFALEKPYGSDLNTAFLDSIKRLLFPSVENEIWNELMERAEDQSIVVFKENLRQLLLTPPLHNQKILGFDPAFRTGCKLALLDQHGTFISKGVIYPTAPHNDTQKAEAFLLNWHQKYGFDYIALGNGTASRESKTFLDNFINNHHLAVKIVIVNEAGASVYSASELAAKEFPTFHVEERSAVSIGRRLIDPLAELVKIDPKSIGVGQYQHDMNQKKLGDALLGVVEATVNEVGVYLNEASASLLSYVAGISASLADSIIAYRETNGPFKSRKELLNVPKLGPKAFTQAAGFLRIRDYNPLDNTGIHPESYAIAEKLLADNQIDISTLGSNEASEKLKLIDISAFARENKVGYPTVKDIIEDLVKPGRDPRDKAQSADLRNDVKEISDLKEGMILNGTVRNIMDFGVFVDIGVHSDGLVHISEMADRFIRSPLEVVKINDIVKVRVISVDEKRNRIGLSMKNVK
ncbi:MAG TPA: Tex family protein [Bacilli bacterium]|nr:Tex family protein [Bacilli bacterium]